MRNILKKYDIEIYDLGFLSDNYKNINYGITILIMDGGILQH